MSWSVVYHHADGVTTVPVEQNLTYQDAEEISSYLNEMRNPAERLDGTFYDAREVA